MADVIDTLRIEVTGDSSDAQGSLERLINTLERIKNVASGSGKSFTTVQKHLDAIAAAADKINSGVASKMQKLADGLKALSSVKNISISSKVASRIVELGAAIDCLKGVDMSQLTKMARGLSALSAVGNVNIPRVENATDASPAASTDGTEHVSSATASVRELGDAVDGTRSRFAALKATTSKVFSVIQSVAVSTATVLKDAFGGAIEKIRFVFKRLGMRVMYRAMNALITAVTKGFKDGINAVYQYSKALDGRFANTLDNLASSFNYLKGSLGAMVAPLINTVAPVIDKIIGKFVDLLNIVNQVFARLSGATTWTKATKVATEYAAAADSATAANKKLKNSLMGIDELNVISDNNAGSGSGGSSAEASNYAFEEVPLDNAYVDGIIDKLKDILWYAGAIKLAFMAWDVGKAIADLTKLSGIKAFSLAAGLTLSVASLVVMVKGITDIISNGINWKNFSETVLGGGGLIAGGALIGKALGSTILGAAIGAIVGGVGMLFAGLWDAIKNGLNWLNGVLIPAGSTLVGTGIGAIIGSAAGPWGTLIGLAVGLLADLVIAVVQNWDEIVAWCSQAIADIGTFFSNLWKDIKGIWGIVAEWFDTTVIQPVVGFFTGLWESISGAVSSCWNSIVEFFSPAVEWFGTLFGEIWQTVSDIFYNIGVIAEGCWTIIKLVWGVVSAWFNDNIIVPVSEFFTGLWESIITYATEAWENIKAVLTPVVEWIDTNIIQPVGKFFSDLWNGFTEKAKAAWEGVKKVFSVVSSFFGKVFSDAWASIVKVFSVAGEIFVDIKDAIVIAFKVVVNGIIKGINKVVAVPFNAINSVLDTLRNFEIMGVKPFSSIRLIHVPEIPLLQLAEGGMVNAGTMFIAGEAGAEVVSQIGNKTGVMNTDEMGESVERGVAKGAHIANEGIVALLRELIYVVQEKDTSLSIGDDVIGRAYDRYTQQRGVRVNSGAFANAY